MKRTFFLLCLFSIIGPLLTSNAQNVPSYLPTNGLVGWWPFTGNAVDSSGNGNNGTVFGATLTTDRFGNTASAYNFSTVGWSVGTRKDEIFIPFSPSFNSSNLTVSAWINQDKITPQEIGRIVSRFQNGYSNPNGQAWTFNVTNSGNSNTTIHPACSDNNCNGCGVTGGVIPLNTWVHLLFTLDGSTVRQYINGTLVNTQSCGLSVNSASNSGISIGVSNQANGWWYAFSGKIDDIAIWNRAIDSNEVRQISQSSSSSGQGFVGIGTTSPAAPLHVRQDTNGETSVLIDNRSTGTSAFTSLRFNGDDGNNLIIFKNNSLRTADGGANTATIRNGAGVLRLQSSANIGLLIDTIGKVNVEDVMNLKPRSGAPTNPVKGDMYFDGVLNKLRVFDGTQWQNCW